MASLRYAAMRTATVLAWLAFAAPVAAQYPSVEPPSVEIQAARNCLCLEQAVGDSRFELQVRNGLYEKAKVDADSLEAEVARTRPTVNVDDRAQIDAFRDLLDRADKARTNYQLTAVPEQQRAVARYNASVDQLNASCKGRSFSTYAWAAARKDLVCPKN